MAMIQWWLVMMIRQMILRQPRQLLLYSNNNYLVWSIRSGIHSQNTIRMIFLDWINCPATVQSLNYPEVFKIFYLIFISEKLGMKENILFPFYIGEGKWMVNKMYCRSNVELERLCPTYVIWSLILQYIIHLTPHWFHNFAHILLVSWVVWYFLSKLFL